MQPYERDNRTTPMENNSPDHDDVLTMKAGENTSRLLLKELVKNVESFITQRELNQAEPALSVTLKRIFYHGLSLDRNVSNIATVFHQKFILRVV